MASKRKNDKPGLEARISELVALCEQPAAEPARRALESALADSRAVLVAAAANAIAKHELTGFHAPLRVAFDRFMQTPEKVDKGCHAKTAIARALYRMEAPEDELYLRGVRHVQLEPVWGGKEDTAAELRVTCGLGLARRHHPATLSELARLLADREVMARIGAASAIGYSGHVDAGVPLLRFKALSGDEDSRVTGACAGALLALDPEGSLIFADELLSAGDPRLFEVVVMALGESRLAGACPLLRRACEAAVLPEARQAVMLALAMLRSEEAWGHLLAIIADEPASKAREALKALSIFAHESALKERVLLAVTERGERELLALARELWVVSDAE